MGVISAERRVKLHGAKALIWMEGDEREGAVPPLHNVIEDILTADSDSDDHFDLQYIPSSRAMDVQSSLFGDFSTMQGKV